MNEPTLQKAMDTLEFLSQNEEARRLYEIRQRALHDEASMIAGAKEEGRKEGIEEGRKEGKEEGREEGKEEVAKKLLEMGLDTEKVIQATGLSSETVKKIQSHR